MKDQELNNKGLNNKELEKAARPLIKYLAENGHPHMIAQVTATGVEVLEGINTVQNIFDYLTD